MTGVGGEAVPKIDMSFVVKTAQTYDVASAGSILLRDVFTVAMLGERNLMSAARLVVSQRKFVSREILGKNKRSYPLALRGRVRLCLAPSRVRVSQMFIALMSRT